MTQDNMVRVYAPIDVQEHVAKAAQEKAAVLAFPEEKQSDLQYIRSLLVSAGTNKNGAHFLPSEMMKAHNTIVHKAIDIEHDEERVIGHMYDCAFLFKDGESFDPLKLMAEYKETSNNPDDVDIDIAVAGVIHKMRFPEYAEQVLGGEWKVSMECYFKDFDIKVGNQIITRDEAQSLGYNPDDLVNGFVKVVAGQKALGKHFVARVLRNITFSGMGIVKNPANPHSIIMETAAHKEMLEKGDFVIDMEHIDNLRGNNKISLRNEKADTQVANSDQLSDNLLRETTPVVGDISADQIFIEVDKETGGIKRILSVDNKEDAALRFTGPGTGGPGTVNSFPDSICKSFKKRVTKFNALDQSEGQVLHEHWCALFEEPCPVIGASAKAPECLRNQRNRTTRDEGDNTLTKTIREHVDDAPSNTFINTLQRPVLTKDAASTEASALREQVRILRNSLKEYVAAEKKTSK